jgi:hypothetical protein
MKRILFVGLAAILVLTALAACVPAADVPTADAAAGAAADAEAQASVSETTVVDTSVEESAALDAALAATTPGDLSSEEAAGLIFMREEEKLAHDVYVKLYELWGLSVFQNIARSEQTHTDAIKNLLDRYGLDDPAAGNGVWVFDNPDLQALYNTLIAQGSTSLADALKVGTAIEEIDILDLEEHLAQADNADIRLVYENMEQGSENHLRAFVSSLQNQTGEVYQPRYLSQEAYDAIMSGATGRGSSQGGAQGRGAGQGQSQGQGRRQGRN